MKFKSYVLKRKKGDLNKHYFALFIVIICASPGLWGEHEAVPASIPIHCLGMSPTPGRNTCSLLQLPPFPPVPNFYIFPLLTKKLFNKKKPPKTKQKTQHQPTKKPNPRNSTKPKTTTTTQKPNQQLSQTALPFFL